MEMRKVVNEEHAREMKTFDDGTRKMKVERRILRSHAAQFAEEEWGAFCWNYTLNYALHSSAVSESETTTRQLKQANACHQSIVIFFSHRTHKF